MSGDAISGDVETLAGEDTRDSEPSWPGEQPSSLIAKGTTLGRYLVLECLGTGGMGVVYAAYDPQLDRKVAIKLVRPGPSRGSGSADRVRIRLLREAQAMAKLSHPNVVAVHDVGTVGVGPVGSPARRATDEQIFVAMELIDGVSLRAWLQARRRGWREVLDVLCQAGRGLSAAHARGFVHRDFKPDNVMIGRDGRVVVMDFGLVRTVEQLPTSSGPLDPSTLVEPESSSSVDDSPFAGTLTKLGNGLGTPAYMAPEQFAGHEADARSDQFSFCVTLYEALYAERPFVGKTIVELAAVIVEGQPRPEPRASAVPSWLRGVVLRGLSPEADDRFATMDELLLALTRDPSRRGRVMALDDALRHFDQSYAIFEHTFGREHGVVARVLDNMGDVHYSRGELDVALARYREALEIRVRVLGARHPDTAQSMLDIGLALTKQRRFDEALRHVDEAAAIFGRALGPSHLHAQQVEDARSELYRAGNAAACSSQ